MPERFGSNESTFDALRGQTLNLPVNGSAAGAGAADSTYLRLDATNDPVTGALDVKVDSADALRVLTSGSAEVFVADTLANLIMGRLNEVWVQETNYLVVDAGGLGDYTTIQDALNYIMGLAGPQTYTILIRDGTYAEILTITGSVSATRTVTLVGLSKEAILAPGLSAAQNVINTGTYTTINCINIKILPTGSSTGAIASIGSGVTTSFERCLIEPLAAMKLANGGSSTANFYRCTLGQAGRTYTNGMAATGGVSSNLNLYYCDILGTAANSKGLVASETYPNTRLYYCKITNGGGALSYDLLQSGGATVTVGRCLYNRTKTSGTITVLDGDIPALTSTDLRAILFYDTEANILAATKDAGTLAVSNDTYYLFQSLGAGTWRKSAFRFQPEGANPDMGLLPPLTDKSRIGYGETYITDKTISNSAIGNNANSTEGSIKEVAADGFYGYISGTYAKFVTGFRFRELNQTYYLEHQPISGGDWIIVESGNSERLGLNGLPSVQGYHVSMGAYPPKLVISGGTF